MDAIMSCNRQVGGRAQKNATAVEGVKDSPPNVGHCKRSRAILADHY